MTKKYDYADTLLFIINNCVELKTREGNIIQFDDIESLYEAINDMREIENENKPEYLN